MKVYVAKVLEETMDGNYCSVVLFNKAEDAREWADNKIEELAVEYDGEVSDKDEDYYLMQSGDEYVTIEIEEQEIY